MSGMDHLRRLPKTFVTTLEPDKDGYLGRECPNGQCSSRYFKVTPGTGLTGDPPCHCPYCGYVSGHEEFRTRDQIEYALSRVRHEVTGALRKDLDAMLRRSIPAPSPGLRITTSVTGDTRPYPIHYYQEKELETEVICDGCGLRYAIYGVFAFCPDCGTHNSLQILNKNLDLALKKMALATAVDADVADAILGDALGSAVAAFDAFGREACRVSAQAAGTPGIADRISFQNLRGAQTNVQAALAVDLASGVSTDQWESICRLFQKRHLFAHSAGVVDQDYLAKASDPRAVLGRKIALDAAEVEDGVSVLRALGQHLAGALSGAQP